MLIIREHISKRGRL